MTIQDGKTFDFHNDAELVRSGFAHMGIYKLTFEFRESNSNKQMINTVLELYGKTEEDIAAINEHYEKVFKKNRERQLNNIMKSLSNYKFYQYDEVGYHEDWDLYYMPYRSWYGLHISDEITRIELSDNSSKSFETNQRVFNEILDILSKAENIPDIECFVEHKAYYDNDAINRKACQIIEQIKDKPIIYNGMEGKIKDNYMYDDSNYLNNYGFFQKRARSRYYTLDAKDVVSQLSKYVENDNAVMA